MVDGGVTPEDQERRLKQYISDNAQYDGLVISIEDDVADGMWAEFFSEINEKRKEREAFFDEIKKPLNAALAVLNSRQHEACDRLKELEYTITQARGSWMMAKDRKIREINAAAISNAEKTGGVAIIQPKSGKTVHTAGGASVGLKTQPSWRLTDEPTITAKHVEMEKMKFDRSDPRLANVPDNLFILQPGLIMAAIKLGQMPEGEHSIEKFEAFSSTSK